VRRRRGPRPPPFHAIGITTKIGREPDVRQQRVPPSRHGKGVRWAGWRRGTFSLFRALAPTSMVDSERSEESPPGRERTNLAAVGLRPYVPRSPFPPRRGEGLRERSTPPPACTPQTRSGAPPCALPLNSCPVGATRGVAHPWCRPLSFPAPLRTSPTLRTNQRGRRRSKHAKRVGAHGRAPLTAIRPFRRTPVLHYPGLMTTESDRAARALAGILRTQARLAPPRVGVRTPRIVQGRTTSKLGDPLLHQALHDQLDGPGPEPKQPRVKLACMQKTTQTMTASVGELIPPLRKRGAIEKAAQECSPLPVSGRGPGG
jgi:hypothetical protein